MNLGLCLCTMLTGKSSHDGKCFRVIKSPAFINSKTIKNVETLRDHFCQHRETQNTWEEVKNLGSVKKEVNQAIVDKGCLLVPMANLAYNFFEKGCVRDFMIEIAEYRASTSQKQLIRLLDKLGQAKMIMRRLDTISGQFKSVCIYLICDQFLFGFLLGFLLDFLLGFLILFFR